MGLNQGKNIVLQSRTAVVVMVDLSSQMDHAMTIDGERKSVGEFITIALNNTLSGIFMRSHTLGTLQNIFDVAVLLYSGKGVKSCFGDITNPFISIEELAKHSANSNIFRIKSITPLDSPDDYEWLAESDYIIEFSGSRAMAEALDTAYRVVTERYRTAPKSDNAPCVINICGGAPDDCTLSSLLERAERIKAIGRDENKGCRMVNILLDHTLNAQPPLEYPSDEELSRNPSALVSTLGEVSSLIMRGSEECRALIINNIPTDIM